MFARSPAFCHAVKTSDCDGLPSDLVDLVLDYTSPQYWIPGKEEDVIVPIDRRQYLRLLATYYACYVAEFLWGWGVRQATRQLDHDSITALVLQFANLSDSMLQDLSHPETAYRGYLESREDMLELSASILHEERKAKMMESRQSVVVDCVYPYNSPFVVLRDDTDDHQKYYCQLTCTFEPSIKLYIGTEHADRPVLARIDDEPLFCCNA